MLDLVHSYQYLAPHINDDRFLWANFQYHAQCVQYEAGLSIIRLLAAPETILFEDEEYGLYRRLHCEISQQPNDELNSTPDAYFRLHSIYRQVGRLFYD